MNSHVRICSMSHTTLDVLIASASVTKPGSMPVK